MRLLVLLLVAATVSHGCAGCSSTSCSVRCADSGSTPLRQLGSDVDRGVAFVEGVRSQDGTMNLTGPGNGM